jgi:adenosine deaminase
MAEVGFHGSPGGLIELLVPAMPAAFTMNDCCWKKETKKKLPLLGQRLISVDLIDGCAKMALAYCEKKQTTCEFTVGSFFFKKKNEMAMQVFDYWPLDYGTFQIF